MDRTNRSDHSDRRKRRQDSPSQSHANSKDSTRRDRRRSQSPKLRESRDYRNDGGRWDSKGRDEDRGQRIQQAKSHMTNGTHGQSRGNNREAAQHGFDRSSGATPANRGRDSGTREQGKPAAAAVSKGGSSSMPFIRNDKPYQYTFRDDSGFELAQELGEVPDDATMRQVMGFAKFRTSHELKIPDNQHNHGIRTVKQAQYRQYMNRRNGFNRPLSPPHD